MYAFPGRIDKPSDILVLSEHVWIIPLITIDYKPKKKVVTVTLHSLNNNN